MTEEQRILLELITDELGGKLEHYVCSNTHTSHKKIVITYDAQQKRQDN